MKKIVFAFLFSTLSFIIVAQTVFQICGTVLDENKKPIRYADIILLSSGDSIILNGTSTDKLGKFCFEKVKSGNYMVKVYFTGYEEKKIDNIIIKNENIDLKNITIKESNTHLDEIPVYSDNQKGYVRGAIVYDVENDHYITGETAQDVLQDIPSIGIDMDERITLRGSETTILVDDVESDLSDMVDQIPSSAIESIEIMAVPSVKYETKNGAGVVNIRLKQNMRGGHYGNFNAGMGIREKKDFDFTYGYNLKKWKYSLLASYKKSKTEIEQDNFRTIDEGNSVRYLQQDQLNVRIPTSFFVKWKTAYYFKPGNFINFQYTLQGKKQELSTSNYTHRFNKDMTLMSVNDIFRDKTEENLFNQFASNYHRQFQKKGHNLDVKFLYSFNVPGNQFEHMVQPLKLESLEPKVAYNSEEREYENDIKLFKLNADYTVPLSKNWKFDIGGIISSRRYNQEMFAKKSILKWDKEIKDHVLTEITRERNFDYNGKSFSLYALLSGGKGKYIYSGGLRYEYVFTEAKTENSEAKKINKLLPSLHLKKTVNKNYSWEFSFSSRSKPPTYMQLNPISRSFSNFNRTSGNPDLTPEYLHQAEWAHRWTKKGRNLNLAFYLKNRKDVIGRYYFLEIENGTRISHSRYENIGDNLSLGIDFTSRFRFGKFNLTPGVNIFHSRITTKKEDSMFEREKIVYNLKLFSTYLLSKKISIQCSGKYYSPLISTYGHQTGYFVMDTGMRMKVLKNKGVVALKLLDIIDSHEYDKVVDQRPGHLIESFVNPNSFMFYLNFSYRFDTTPQKGKK